ncbi:RNA-directed DNA polymerase, eukaryota, reverse transcriptase zinc-binding domain protein [Tanacetum coccineum]
MNTSEKQKEVLNLIRSEQLKVCDVLETTLKMKKLHNVCDKMFHGWEWVSNMQECNKGCKIVVGWENNETNVHVLNKTSQSLLCVISSEKPWCIAGDMNVTLHPNEHSCGSSTMTTDMMEFQDCLNEIEVEDICKSSLHFTWTKNLHKTKAGIMTGILKKLDRVMSNEDFIKQYPQAHAKFLPYDIQNRDELFDKRISEEVAERMINVITDAEIKNVMFDIDDYKAPEPDGFTTTFFKKAWDIVRSDVCRAVKEFFTCGKMLEELNATVVSLIPKVRTSIKEIMRGYNRKGGQKISFKIDLQKAYDTVNWEFLKSTLVGFGFHERMIQWIMQCVTTIAFTLNVNGVRIGYFKGGRGLRKGDPISP